MISASLALQDVLGDAIIAQLATDAITAEVTTNPTQGASMPLVVIGEDSETAEDENRDQIRSSIAHNVYVHTASLVQSKEIANSVLQAIGPNATAFSLGASFYEVRRELEANDTTKEPRPEGFIYHSLIRVRYFISHTGA